MQTYASYQSVENLLKSLEVPQRLVIENLERLFKNNPEKPSSGIPLELLSQTINRVEVIAETHSTSSSSYLDWPSLDGIKRPITKNWRARVAVIAALCEITKKTRIQIGYLRLDFIDEMIKKGKLSKFWNINFVQYVLNLFNFSLFDVNDAETPAQPKKYRPIPNLTDFFKRFSPPYKYISPHWKPSVNTQKALYSRGAPYDVTNHPAMVNGFINNVKNGDIPDGNFNTRYIQYVVLKREQMEEIESSLRKKELARREE